MDFENYRKSYFADPVPESRFEYIGLHGITLFFSDYEAAVAYYSRVLGPPAYVEGKGTHGWKIGNTWLTLLEGGTGSPQNVEVAFVMKSPGEAERLQAAFIEAGGVGQEPTDQLMYQPIRYCPVKDPFGTAILVYAPLSQAETDCYEAAFN